MAILKEESINLLKFLQASNIPKDLNDLRKHYKELAAGT
jgi:hypothetical protein